MNRNHPPFPVAEGPGREAEEALKSILQDLLRTREVRHGLFTTIPLLLDVWVGDSRWMRPLSRIASAVMKKLPAAHLEKATASELQALLRDKDFVVKMGGLLPTLANTCTGCLGAAATGFADLPAAERENFVEKWLTDAGRGRSGELLTNLARMFSEMNRENPQWLADALRPGLRRMLMSVDFGELKETAENSRGTMAAVVEMANDEIWHYPSKVVLLLSLLPEGLNLVANATKASLQKLNEVPPDLLTDIFLSLLLEMDAAAIAGLLNQLAEMARKIDTGSALLGEPGAPHLPKAMSDMLDKVAADLDWQAVWRGRLAAEEVKTSWEEARLKCLLRNPDDFHAEMIGRAKISNLRLNARNRRRMLLETEVHEGVAGGMAEQLAVFDTQLAADSVNRVLETFNQIWEREPELCADMCAQFCEAINVEELEMAAETVLQGSGEAFRTAARSAVPGLVTWVCDVLQPEDDDFEEAAAQARKALRRLLMAGEA